MIRAEATLSVSRPKAIGDWSPQQLRGLVNPDGEHPLMVRVPTPRPFFMDIFPITIEDGMLVVDTGTVIQRSGFDESQTVEV